MKVGAMTVGCILGIGMVLVSANDLRAFSVGDIVVQSRRGMPFLAEVPLTLNPQERGRGVVVTVGDRKEYRAEGIPRPEMIDRLEVSWITGTRDMVLIASTEPVRASAFDLVLSVRSGQVTIVRTYHVGLPAPAASAPPTETHSPAPRRPKPRRVAVAASTPVTPMTTSKAAVSPSWLQHLPERYGPVEKGTTLFAIVRKLGAPKETIWQALVRIWQANKTQFLGGNMHGLRSGGSLIIPPDLAAGIKTMSRREAQRVVTKQWNAWQEVRRAVSGRQRVVPAQPETAALQQAPAAAPGPEPEPAAEAAPIPAPGTTTTSEPEKPVAPSTVMLPAKHTTPATPADMQSVLQGLERLLAQRLPQTVPAGEAGGTTTFVSATDLQAALQGLEERLTQQLQANVRKISLAQQAAQLSQQSARQKPTILEQMLPSGSMLYVLVMENALLLLLAGIILWRWLRSRV